MDTKTTPATVADVTYAAENLMREHGLMDNGWRFALDNAKNRAGCCHFDPCDLRITMSRDYIEGWLREGDEGYAHIENTILHEIAHAIAGLAAGHGPRWKRVAQSIGCTADRCGERAPTQAKGRYEAVCYNCDPDGRSLGWRWRLDERTRRGGACRSCRTRVTWIDHKEVK
jgi:predicted SprT family Zn-dependent metalloprotease